MYGMEFLTWERFNDGIVRCHRIIVRLLSRLCGNDVITFEGLRFSKFNKCDSDGMHGNCEFTRGKAPYEAYM